MIMNLRKPFLLTLTGVVFVLLVVYRGIVVSTITGEDTTRRNQMSGFTNINIPSRDHGTYVLVLRLAGQQGSGVRSLSVFQCVLGSIHGGFYIIEPNIQETHLATVDGDQLKFSSLFDFDYFNERSRDIGFPEMVEVDQFTKYSSNYTIYVYIRPDDKYQGMQKVVWDAKVDETHCLDSEQISLLAQPYKGALSKAEHVLSTLKPGTCIVRIVDLWVCAYRKCITRPVSAIRNFLFGEWSPQEVTLVFTHWYNKFFIPVDTPLNGVDCLRKYAQNEVRVQFRPSNRLVRDAGTYESLFLGGRNKLAIMLRVERVIKHYLMEDNVNTSNRSLEKCFDKVLTLKLNAEKPFVTLDIGKFGTQSRFRSTKSEMLAELSNGVLMSLYDNKWSVKEWENSFAEATGGITDVSYIAALQRMIASRADCLVLMGGGSFQSLAVYDYLEYHKNRTNGTGWVPCIQLVCVMTTRNTEVQKVIENYKLDPNG